MDGYDNDTNKFKCEISHLIENFEDCEAMLEKVRLSTEAALLHDMAFSRQDEGLWLVETDLLPTEINSILLACIEHPRRRPELLIDLFDLLCKSIFQYKSQELLNVCEEIWVEESIENGTYRSIDPYDAVGVKPSDFC